MTVGAPHSSGESWPAQGQAKAASDPRSLATRALHKGIADLHKYRLTAGVEAGLISWTESYHKEGALAHIFLTTIQIE